ncbi:MAG: hypothetical protein IKL65_06360 [Bacilli bacterium]|nr:hypothetical protein [Bacilli bacterium]
MTEEMVSLYKKLSKNEKRNEFSSLLVKTDKLLDELLIKENIRMKMQSKNYDKIENMDMTEDDILLFFYEDVWNIKNKVLAILASKSE